jgi:hypothetical protein
LVLRADLEIVASNGGMERGRLSSVPVASWIALALVSIFAVLFLTVGPRHRPDRTTAPDRRNLAELQGVPQEFSPDGTLVLVFQPADRGCIHEGTRVTFQRHRVGRVVEVDPGLGGILVRMVFRRDFVRKAKAMTMTLVPRRSRANPSVTEVAVLRGQPTLRVPRGQACAAIRT